MLKSTSPASPAAKIYTAFIQLESAFTATPNNATCRMNFLRPRGQNSRPITIRRRRAACDRTLSLCFSSSSSAFCLSLSLSPLLYTAAPVKSRRRVALHLQVIHFNSLSLSLSLPLSPLCLSIPLVTPASREETEGGKNKSLIKFYRWDLAADRPRQIGLIASLFPRNSLSLSRPSHLMIIFASTSIDSSVIIGRRARSK